MTERKDDEPKMEHCPICSQLTRADSTEMKMYVCCPRCLKKLQDKKLKEGDRR